VQTHQVLDWDDPWDEDHDFIIKEGRSTGLTIGKPVALAGSVKAQLQPGVHLLTPGDTPGSVNYQLCQTSPTLYNQYMVKHKSPQQQFAVEGDSGSVCYIRDHRTPWELRPWGLLHGVIASNIYSFAILSPMQAVMSAMPPDCVLISPQNEHLLGKNLHRDD